MTRAYSYVRMSTASQLKGDSLRRQLELTKKYAAEHGLELIDDGDMRDIGRSAYRGDNIADGALGDFLVALQQGRIPKGSYLLVESLDRISRDKVVEALSTFLTIIQAGIVIVTLSDQAVYRKESCDTQQLMVSLTIMMRAHEESVEKGKRVAEAWASKRRMACDKKLTALCPGWLKLNANRTEFEVIDDRANVVRGIYSESVDGLGADKIARRLNQRAIPTFGRSSAWSTSSVKKILSNPAAIGFFQPHRKIGRQRIPDGGVIESYFPPVVSEEVFYANRHAREARTVGASGRKGPTYSNLFTGIISCLGCNSALHFINKGSKPKGGTYLYCSGSRSGLCEVKKGWSYPDFEASFLTFVDEVDITSVLHQEGLMTERQRLTTHCAEMEGRVSELRTKERNLIGVIENGGSDLAAIAQRLRTIQSEIDELGELLKQAKQRIASMEEMPIKAHQSQETVRKFLAHGTDEGDSFLQRAKVASHIRSLVEMIYVELDGQIRARGSIDFAETALSNSEEDRVYLKEIEAAALATTGKQFVVEFKGGGYRYVYPDPNDAKTARLTRKYPIRLAVSGAPNYGFNCALSGPISNSQ